MVHILTTFGESSSGLGALGLDGRAFVIQLITFVLAYVVLRKYAFKPILKVLNDRKLAIEKGVQLGDEMQKQRTELEKKVTAELLKARAEADSILAGASDTSKATIRAAEDTARAKAANILKEAETNAEQAVKRARKALESELVGLISDATEAIIDEKVDAKKDAVLIDKALAGQRS